MPRSRAPTRRPPSPLRKQLRVLAAQFALQEFAARVLRQGLGEHDVLRHLEMRQMLGAMGMDRVLRQRLPGLDHDHRDHRLDPARMRHADHRHLGDLRQLVDHFLDLAAGDVLAAGLDHVLLAVDDGDVALGVDGGEIAGMKPAALERGLGALVVVEIAEHQVRRTVHDLADLARRHVAQLIVDDAGLHIEHGATAGAGLAQLVFRPHMVASGAISVWP